MTYTISDLEQLSGVHSHTIRIWEQRYNALTPTRSQGNTRLYDDEQLVKLLNIVSLNQVGLKISKICSLTNDAIEDLLNKQYEHQSDDDLAEFYLSRLIKFGLEFNNLAFNNILNDCLQIMGITDTYRRVTYPLLVRLGLMWRKDDICPAHEHFISNIIRQKLFAQIDKINLTDEHTATWLLFLPEDEDHDIGLIFAYYLLKLNYQNVIFLGNRTPLASVDAVISTINIDHVLLFMTKSRGEESSNKYILDLTNTCKNAKIHLAGNATVINKLKNIDHINWFKSLDEFEKSIKIAI